MTQYSGDDRITETGTPARGPRPAQSVAGPTQAYAILRGELERAGCFNARPWAEIGHMALVLGTCAIGYGALLLDPGSVFWLLGLVLVPFAWVQAGFIAHDAGHGAITSKRRLADTYGLIFMTLVSGLSYSYFRSVHRGHHAHVNEAAQQSEGLGDGPYVAWLSVLLKGFLMKAASLRFLSLGPQRTQTDRAFMILHIMLWLGVPALVLGPWTALLNYALVTLLSGPYVGTILLVNHTGTRIVGAGETIPFLHRQLLVTRNLGTSWLDNLLFGGANHHVEIISFRRCRGRICVRHGRRHGHFAPLGGFRISRRGGSPPPPRSPDISADDAPRRCNP